MFRTAFLLLSISLACGSFGPSAVLAQDATDPLQPDLSGIPEAKLAAIREHLEVMGAAETLVESFGVGLEAQREANPSLPDVFWDELVDRMVADVDRLVDALIPVYDAQYSLEEIEQLTSFYLTPLGQRLVESSRKIGMESASIGQRWGMVIGAEVALDLAKRGILVGGGGGR